VKDLQELMHDAVAGVEPADRLAAIQARTATPARAARRWWYAAGGVALATAASVAVVAAVGEDDSAPDHHHGEHGMTASDPALPSQLVPVYFVGQAPRGEHRLFRELDEVAAGDPLERALERIQRPPTDPDYQSAWPQGSLESVAVSSGVIEVELGPVQTDQPFGTELANQQLVYTLLDAVPERLPVQLVQDGRPVGDPMTAAPELDVLSLVSITEPTEGSAYTGRYTPLFARGEASSFEATVPWEIRTEGGETVREGYATAEGWMDGLYPWETEVDLSGLPAGTYTFVATTADPSGEGAGVFTDTRTITVR
jgi:immunoglobulin-like protein involved in spore germination/sporulation and spore germination protein